MKNPLLLTNMPGDFASSIVWTGWRSYFKGGRIG